MVCARKMTMNSNPQIYTKNNNNKKDTDAAVLC